MPSTSSGPAVAADCIRVRGARVHNLQNIDVDIPRDALVVITGVSGSGKSSLAFDTLFAEGQRRYLETLSAQTRAYLDQMQRPDVDEIEGLPPVLSIEQHGGAVNPRSTLATTTGIHDFLRLLYARAGTPHCPNCGRELTQQTTQAIVEGILALETGRRVMILAPLVRGKKGVHRELFEKICREGFVRARVDGVILDAASPPELKKSKTHDIDVVVDRIVVKEGLRARLFESVELALRHGNGACIVSHEEGPEWRDRLFSSRFACPDCDVSFSEIEPRTFSFNSPYGACPACQGLGVIPEDGGKLSGERPGPPPGGVPAGWLSDKVCPACNGARLAPIGRAVTFAGTPIHELLALNVVDGEQAIGSWLHALPPLARGGRGGRVDDSQGTEQNATAIAESTKLEIESSATNQGADAAPLAGPPLLVAARLLPEIHRRLQYLRQVGLDYLSLDRPTQSLSGGEFQRARIAGCLGAGLIGVGYILDEPTIGLHPRDTQRLLDTLIALRDQGNSLIVVEHDLDVMVRADHLIDLGPGAGREGGRVVAHGTPEEVMRDEQSLTGQYLKKGTGPFAAAGTRPRAVDLSRALVLDNAHARNLRDLTIAFPLGVVTCVTGVSGSGKSTLVMETLVPRVRAALPPLPEGEGRGEGGAGTRARPHPNPLPEGEGTAHAGGLSGIEHIDRLVEIDQSPLGRNARSNPATASGMWDEIRRVFARTREARVRGFRASRFSFNAAGGRCEECRGQGTRRLSMQFLPDLDVVCPVCRGARFNRQTLQIKFRGKSVADVLEMRIDEAAAFFESFSRLAAMLQTFRDVGLGYLALGQSAATLSGGEAQRIKLAAELGRTSAVVPSSRTLYVLDEPTTGLHPADIARLMDLLERLAGAGHSVIVIEHQLDVIARSDWVIDLGPEGGPGGGRIVATGTPRAIAMVAESHTGAALRRRVYLECGDSSPL